MALRLPPAPRVPRTSYGSAPSAHPYRSTRTDFHTTGIKGLPKIPALHHPSATISHPSAGHVSAVKKISKTDLGISSSSSGGAIPQMSASFLKAPGSAAGQLTPEQVAHLIYEHQHKSSGGFLDEVKSGVTGLGGELLAGIGNVLSRPLWGVARGVDLATQGGHSFNLGRAATGFEQGFTGSHPETFGQLLKSRHILDDHSVLRGISGFGLDVGADPLNLLLLAAVPFTGGASGGVLAAELGTREIALQTAREGVLAGLGRAGGTATIGDIIGRAKGVQQDYAHFLETSAPGLGGKTWRDVNASELSQIEPDRLAEHLRMTLGGETAGMVQKSAEKYLPHVIQPRLVLPTLGGFKTIGLLPKAIAGRRILPYAPTILNIAEKRGLLGSIPAAGFMAEHAADLLKPGWRDPLTHLAEQGRKYNIEAYRSYLTKHFHGDAIQNLAGHLSDEEMRRALDVAEMEGSVHELRAPDTQQQLDQLYKRAHEEGGLTDEELHHLDQLDQEPKVERNIDDSFLTEQGLSKDQVAFVHRWHDLMERQHKLEQGFGVHHEGEIGARVYVPRVKTGGEVGAFVTRAITKGFQHAREADELGLQEMERRNVEGTLKGGARYVTNPSELVEHRLLAGAHAIGWQGFRHAMGDVFGAPAVVADAAKTAMAKAEVGRLEQELQMWEKQGELLPRDHEQIMEEVKQQVDQALTGHVENIRQTLEQLDQDVKDLEGQAAAHARQRRLSEKAEPGKIKVHDTTGIPPAIAGRRAAFYDPKKGTLHVASGEVTHSQLQQIGKLHPSVQFKHVQAEISGGRWRIPGGVEPDAKMIRTLQEHENLPVHQAGEEIAPARAPEQEATAAARQAKLGELRKARRVRARAEERYAREVTSHVHEHSYGAAHYASEEARGNATERAANRQLTRTHKAHIQDVRRLEREERSAAAALRDAVAEHGHLANASDEHVHEIASNVAHAFFESKRNVLKALHDEFDRLPEHVRAAGKEAPLTKSEAIAAMERELVDQQDKLRELLRRTYGAMKAGQERGTREAIRRQVAKKLDDLQLRLESVRLMKGVVGGTEVKQAVAQTTRRFKELGLAEHPTWQRAVAGAKVSAIEDSRRDALLHHIQEVEQAESPDDLLHVLDESHPVYQQLRDASEHLAAFAASGTHRDIDELAQAAEDALHHHKSVRKQLGTARGRLTRFEARNQAGLAEGEKLPEREAARAKAKNQALREFERSTRTVGESRDRLAASDANVVRLTHELEQLGPVTKGPAPRHFERSIEAKKNLAQKIRTEVGPQRIARLSQPGRRQIQRMTEALEKSAKGYAEETTRRSDRLAEAEERLEQGYEQLNPLVKSGNLKLLDSVPGKAFPPDVHQALTRIEETMKDPAGWEPTLRVLRNTMSRWKLSVTALNPGGYRIRNSLSDVWNAYISGVPLRAMPLYLAKANRLMLRARQGNHEAILEMMKMEAHGVTQGLFAGDVEVALRSLQGKGRGGPWRRYVKMMTSVNKWGENVGRVAHMQWRLAHGSKTYADAAWHVRRAHFDYADLTPAEQKIKDFAVPFYTWTRKNVPYQLVQIFARPGRVSTFYKAAQESETAAGHTQGELIPSFFRDAGAFKVPGLGPHVYLLPQIGLMDIGRVTTKRGLLGMLGPQYQVLAALQTGKNPYTGGEINPPSHEFVPANAKIASLIGALAPGLAGHTERTVGKRQVGAAGINPMLSYLLGETGVPLLRYALNRNPVAEAENPETNRALNQFLGAPLYTANQSEEKLLAELQDADSFKKFIRVLRDENLYPESKRRKPSPHQQAILKSIYQAQARP